MITLVAVLSIALPIVSVSMFIIGFNINADKKIFRFRRKTKDTEADKLLKRIDNAHL